MALEKDNVTMGIRGGIFWDPTGTATIDETTDLEATPGVIHLGYISEDGVEISDETSSTPLVAWQNRAEVRTVFEEVAVQISGSFIENKQAVRELWHKSTETSAGVMDWKPGSEVRGRLIVEYIDPNWTGGDEGEYFLSRYVFHNVTIAETEAITLASGEAVAYGMTFRATPNDSGAVSRNYFVAVEVVEEDPEEEE